MSKPQEWFAVKRSKANKSYQFYPPNKKNKFIIESIAPDGGNFEVITLIDKTKYDKAINALKSLVGFEPFNSLEPDRASDVLLELGEL